MMGPLAMVLLLAGAADDPRRDDFAYSIEVRPDVESPLYRVRLPLAVYQSVTRSDLGDLRVFNAAGALVPHELWMPDDDKVERRTLPVRVFPLLEATPEELSSIRLQIESGEERASISLAPGGAQAAVTAYLIDPGPIEHPYPGERLVLHWSEPAEGFVRELQLEESDDLSSWRTSTSAVVADLRRDGERLLRNDIPLPSKLPRYLRITSREGSLPMVVHRVDLVLSSRVVETAWLEVGAVLHEEGEEDGLRFETPGPVLVEEIEVLPPERNTWTGVQLFSRPDAKSPWVLRGRGAVYRFQLGAHTRLDVTATRDRFWRLSTDKARGGFGGSVPGLRVGYRPDDVVFVARGEAPFEIAFGSGGLNPPPRSAESLRAIGTVRDGRLAPSTELALGDARAIAGERALREPLIPDWKRFVLWAVLVTASLVLLMTARAALSSSS